MTNYFEKLDRCLKEPKDILTSEDLFNEILNDRPAIVNLLKPYFQKVAKDPYAKPTEITANNLNLSPASSSRIYSLALSVHEAGAVPDITTQYAYSIIAPLSGSIEIDHYTLPDYWKIDVFDPDITATHAFTRHQSKHEVGRLDPLEPMARRIRFLEPTVLLKLISPPVLPFEWSFDLKTGCAWQSISTLRAETNAPHHCLAAAALGDEVFVAPLTSLLRHPRHFVRWSAAKALGAIDGHRGIKALHSLSDDPHPHVKKASLSLLSKYGEIQ